ncbi:MAG: hypothetical protein QOD30_1379 [Actinomycetota bacterium]|nr:hypothetical protein [Actinomycetota bacterium]
MRRHPSYGYEIPEPRSHVQVLWQELDDHVEQLAEVVDLASFRLRRAIRA